MSSDEKIEMWKNVENGERNDPMMTEWFPVYYVSQPPHRDELTPVYYKVVSPRGPVFWRRRGDDSGRETTLYDVLMESKNGFGVQRLDKEYTPWADE